MRGTWAPDAELYSGCHPWLPPSLQEKVKAKALRVQGRVVAEEELRQILQAGRGLPVGQVSCWSLTCAAFQLW